MKELSKNALMLHSEKTQTVRYKMDVKENDGIGLTDAYIRKEILPIPFPPVVVITIETLED